MNSNFESTFPPDYRKKDVEQVLKLVTSGKFCQLISLPGGGKATLLRILANKSNDSALFVYLNLLELPNLEQPTIDKFILLHLGKATIPTDPLVLSQTLKDTVAKIVNAEDKTIVLLFDHFDEFQNQLQRDFYQKIRSLKSIAKYKFSAVFATRRDLVNLVDEQILKEFYDFFVDNAVYMQLSDEIATNFLLSQVEKNSDRKLSLDNKKKLIELTGGHTKILKVCAESVLLSGSSFADSLLQKQIVQAALFEIWLYLTPAEQKMVATSNWQLATSYLLELGLVKNNKIMIPLFEEFVKKQAANLPSEPIIYDEQKKEIKKGGEILSDLLSQREFKLLKFFIQNQGRIIERDEIINNVWDDLQSKEGVTDQALDQLIFRLRQKIEENPTIPSHVLTVKGRGIKFTP